MWLDTVPYLFVPQRVAGYGVVTSISPQVYPFRGLGDPRCIAVEFSSVKLRHSIVKLSRVWFGPNRLEVKASPRIPFGGGGV